MRPGERIFLIVFAVCNLVVPLACVEMYPFSMVPMYCNRLHEVATYRVVDPQGRQLPVRAFSLDLTNLGGREATPFHRHKARVMSPDSVNVLGCPPPRDDEVVAVVRAALRRTEIPWVRVERTMTEALDGSRAGPGKTHSLTVMRP